MKKFISFFAIILCLCSVMLVGCTSPEDNPSNTFLCEKTKSIDNEYVFEITAYEIKDLLEVDGTTYQSKFDDGKFIICSVTASRKLIQNPAEKQTISYKWFKIKKGVGEKTSDGKHYTASNSFAEFDLESGDSFSFNVVFEVENYFLTMNNRTLVVEVDRPYSYAPALEIVLKTRPN